jgi:hypothetical protein
MISILHCYLIHVTRLVSHFLSAHSCRHYIYFSSCWVALLYRAECHRSMGYVQDAIADYREALPLLSGELEAAENERKQLQPQTSQPSITISSSSSHADLTSSSQQGSPTATGAAISATVSSTAIASKRTSPTNPTATTSQPLTITPSSPLINGASAPTTTAGVGSSITSSPLGSVTTNTGPTPLLTIHAQDSTATAVPAASPLPLPLPSPTPSTSSDTSLHGGPSMRLSRQSAAQGVLSHWWKKVQTRIRGGFPGSPAARRRVLAKKLGRENARGVRLLSSRPFGTTPTPSTISTSPIPGGADEGMKPSTPLSFAAALCNEHFLLSSNASSSLFVPHSGMYAVVTL